MLRCVLHYLKLYEEVIDTVWPFNTSQDNRKGPVGTANGDCDRLIEVTA